MKTQINDIRRGSQYVSGTSYAIRYERFDTILDENGQTLNITYKGVVITLNCYSSVSGKTTWYSGDLTDEQIKALFPDDTKYNQSPELVAYNFCLVGDCTAHITRFRRKSIEATWKAGYEYRLDNNDIVIL